MSTVKKSIIIGIGALVLSTLSIQASDTLRGLDSRLTGLVSDSSGPCGTGEVQVLLGSHALCVDVYEVSPGDACPVSDPKNQIDTQGNMNSAECFVATAPDRMPWTYIGLTQSQQMCARSGKRLPSNEEWYKIASGMADQSSCVVDKRSSPQPAGSTDCITPSGVHDVVGNVWEWIDAQVVDGTYEGRTIPESGYVSLVDTNGIVVETSPTAYAEFGDDYAWTKTPGIYGVVRGGFYGSGDDAGIFAQNLTLPLDSRTAGVGFRCVRDI